MIVIGCIVFEICRNYVPYQYILNILTLEKYPPDQSVIKLFI